MVLAEGIDRYQQSVREEVTHVEASLAGLRAFAPEHTPLVGFDAGAEGFFWLADHGGYGIQIAPALSDIDLGEDHGPDADSGMLDQNG